MAEVQETGGNRSRKKNLDLNLVPFIDLMSVLITFLLITAVWTQVSMIQIGTSIYGKRQENQEKPEPPKKVDVPLKLEIRSTGYLLTVATQKFNFPLINNEYDDQGLMQQLAQVKQQYEEKTDGAIAMQDDLPYERLIRGMDDMLKTGFVQLAVLTGGPP
ncbi:MAG: tolR protein [Bdellovibrio sp.]|nr:MAG: tolR protein [Bdellovibrio sp.]